MSTVNLQIITGRVGQVNPLRYTAGAKPAAVCEVSVATDYTVRGEKQTTWHRCVFWRDYAESVHRHTKPGTLIYIQGRTEDQEHDGKFYRKVQVEKFRILAGGVWPDDVEVKPSHMPGPDKSEKTNPMERTGSDGVHHDTNDPGAPFDDDIPF